MQDNARIGPMLCKPRGTFKCSDCMFLRNAAFSSTSLMSEVSTALDESSSKHKHTAKATSRARQGLAQQRVCPSATHPEGLNVPSAENNREDSRHTHRHEQQHDHRCRVFDGGNRLQSLGCRKAHAHARRARKTYSARKLPSCVLRTQNARREERVVVAHHGRCTALHAQRKSYRVLTLSSARVTQLQPDCVFSAHSLWFVCWWQS
jgi:hypothetical protein